MFDPAEPLLKDLSDLKFDADNVATLELNHFKYEVHYSEAHKYTFRIKRIWDNKLISLMTNMTEEKAETALRNTQLMDKNPEITQELCPTYH